LDRGGLPIQSGCDLTYPAAPGGDWGAGFIGYVRAPDARSAIEAAARDYKISDRLVDRLIATPEE